MSTQGLQLPFGIKPINPTPVDAWSGPYYGSDLESAKSLANTSIPESIRFQTMEVRLVVDGVSYKFWYNEGTSNSDLVAFSAVGSSGSSQGTQGTQGTTGSGTQGIEGQQGTQGTTGSGTQGTQGRQGTSGSQGTTGTQGATGAQGAIGAGAQGTGGTQGIQGIQGVQGIQGIGIRFVGEYVQYTSYQLNDVVTSNGSTYILVYGTGEDQLLDNADWAVFTMAGAQGIQGIQGIQGRRGSGGCDGIQGTQGTTGTGTQGTGGTQGATGTGTQGTTGSQGTGGTQGTTGTGTQGLQGIQGMQGSDGVMSLEPNQGLTLSSGTLALGTKYNTTMGDEVYSVSVGGASADLALNWKNKSIVQVLDVILFPTILPSISSNKSVDLTISGASGNLEIGQTITRTLNASFNQGRIRNGDGILGELLVGSATQYSFSGTGISTTNQIENTLIVSNMIMAGSNDWSVTVSHDAGTGLYYDNKSNSQSNLDASRLSGTTSDTSTPAITGIYPYFWGVSNTQPSLSDIATLVSSGSANKVLSVASGTITITFNASSQYFWFAHASDYTTKTKWYANQLNNGDIGSYSDLFGAIQTQNFTNAYWTGINFKVYVSNYATTTSGGMEMRNS